MRWSKTLIPTLRQTPTEAVVPSHQLMLRAGLIQQVAAGSYSYLPLGFRVLQKVTNIIREEMNSAGSVEVFLPTLQPIHWLEQTGRREVYGDNLFTVIDRHGRTQALGPTHEEVITNLVSSFVSSYRQLPLTLYQIQTKFRDEYRPRFGVIRSREFQMKDAYSFHLTTDCLANTYEIMRQAYINIFTRCGLDFVQVEAESGPMGGSSSHEFMVLCDTGEDTILSSDKNNYAANVEKCEIGPRSHSLTGPPTGDLTTVHTPDMATIDDVCKFMKVKPKNMLKTLVCRDDDDNWFIAVVRGDHDLNEAKLRAATNPSVTLADDTAARSAGFTIGFVGPHAAVDIKNTTVIIDHDAAQDQFWATGANQSDHHIKHFNWNRDLISPLAQSAESRVIVADIRNAKQGDPSPKNDSATLTEFKGIEVGHIFQLGSKYTNALDFHVLDEDQNSRDVFMGCYGIGVNRIIAAAIESQSGHDDNGIIWPTSIAPYHVIITPIRYEGETKKLADQYYDQLTEQGFDVLLDDRDERPGVKFNDADLIGIPVRITIGDKSLANNQVELKPRTSPKPQLIDTDKVITTVIKMLTNT